MERLESCHRGHWDMLVSLKGEDHCWVTEKDRDLEIWCIRGREKRLSRRYPKAL